VEQALLERFEMMLHDEKNRLLAQATQTVSQAVTNTPGQLADYADVATVESDRTCQMRIRDRERKLIRKIDQAMTRITEGTFGICERCGEEISVKRLEARPVTTFCIECKTKLEEEEQA